MNADLLAALILLSGSGARAEEPTSRVPPFPPKLSVAARTATGERGFQLAFEPVHLPAEGASLRFALPPLKKFRGMSVLAVVRTTSTETGHAPLSFSVYTAAGALLQTADHCWNTDRPKASCGEELWLPCGPAGGEGPSCDGDTPTELVAVFTPLVHAPIELQFSVTVFDPHE